MRTVEVEGRYNKSDYGKKILSAGRNFEKCLQFSYYSNNNNIKIIIIIKVLFDTLEFINYKEVVVNY